MRVVTGRVAEDIMAGGITPPARTNRSVATSLIAAMLLVLDLVARPGVGPAVTIANELDALLADKSADVQRKIGRGMRLIADAGCGENARLKPIMRTLILYHDGSGPARRELEQLRNGWVSRFLPDAALQFWAKHKFRRQIDGFARDLGISASELEVQLRLLSKDRCNSDERILNTARSLAVYLCDPGAHRGEMKQFVLASPMQCCCVKAFLGTDGFERLL